MKKIFSILIFTFLFSSVQAQTETGQSVVTLNVGYSLIGNAISTALQGISTEDNVKASSTPVIIFAYDYGLSDNFSIGLFGSFQSTSANFKYSYGGFTGDSTSENIDVSSSRMNFAIRPNFHYGSSENLDMYSGVRVGMLLRNFDHTSTDDNFDNIDILDGSRFTFGLTLFGVRYYVTDAIGLNMEIGLGVPYAVNGGVNFRF